MAYQGNTLFVGDFANPNSPLWLSALNPTATPANLTVSSMTVSHTGGVIIESSLSPPYDFGEIVFFRGGLGGGNQARMKMNVSKNVPTKGIDTEYVSMTDTNGQEYDDLALAGLQIFGQQVTLPAANTGAAGYLTQGSLPFSVRLYTGLFETGDIRGNAATVSTLTVSSLTEIGTYNTDVFRSSTVNTNFLNSSNTNFSTMNTINANITGQMQANIIAVSTLAVSTFALVDNVTLSTINISTFNANNANILRLSTGTITAGVGTFSTIQTLGGGGSVTASTLVSDSLSTVVAITKDIFTSTMTFNATLSPNFDLGLGGIVGGLVGSLGANALSVGLGAAGLGTGIASLALARQFGGINPNVFQTINGTSQLQFSTLGLTTQSIYATTDSPSPTNLAGNILFTSTIIPAGALAMRTISDPLNLANTDGTAGKGIQGFSQWVSVYPGPLQLGISSITSLQSSNFLDFGNATTPYQSTFVRLANKANPGNSVFIVDGVIECFGGLGNIQGNNGIFLSNAGSPVLSCSTINNVNPQGGVYTTNIGIYPGITTSTMLVSSLTFGASSVANLSIANNLTVGGVATVQNNLNVTNTITATSLNITNINGSPYSSGSGVPIGTMIMWPGGSSSSGPINPPAGYLQCIGQTLPISSYAALYAAIGNTWGGTGGSSFRLPDTRGRTPFGSIVDGPAGGQTYEPVVFFQSVTVTGTGINGDTNNGWFVTGTTLQVYPGMTFNFAGAVGTRTVFKILGNNGIGDGWTTPFVIVWNPLTVPTAFPVFAATSQAILKTLAGTTIAPYIGKQPDTVQPPSFNNQLSYGSPGNTQAIDQTSPHTHAFFRGGREAAAGADYTAGFPNVGQLTGPPQSQYNYTAPGGVLVTGTNTQNNLPPMFAVFYLIRYI